jgi:hypothetical protein
VHLLIEILCNGNAMLWQTVGCHGPSLPVIDMKAGMVLAVSLLCPEHVKRRRERSLSILLDSDNAIASGRLS